ncbi:hypothetical protein STAN_7183 [Streptomyces sp. CBMAI 2042]|uniref:hypothetical protein n=1 Tax=Streptomyces sp. CBMAI 2042 TaxID=2305222 RepID=UPI000F1CF691|nr:hypothetical protein [Streptomyces sp. CBMAI 2042]RLV64363.1 hypothetical protein STAN_7183 [Streptomyces sp. CBMAI 2042]
MPLTTQISPLSSGCHPYGRKQGTAAEGYRVRTVSGATCRAFLTASPSGARRVRLSVGLFSTARRGRDGRPALLGVVTLAAPADSSLLTKRFPWLIPFEQSAELGEPVLLAEVPPEVVTWFVVQAKRIAARHSITGIAAPAAGRVDRVQGKEAVDVRSSSLPRTA